MEYRKKPVVIDAWQYLGNPVSVQLLDAIETSGRYVEFHNDYMTIETLEGTMRANYGDYIIKGVNGELYPCKHDIFKKTYDDIDTPSPLQAENKALKELVGEFIQKIEYLDNKSLDDICECIGAPKEYNTGKSKMRSLFLRHLTKLKDKAKQHMEGV